MTNKTALLLIHGFGGGAWDYRPLEKFLVAQGHEVEFFEFFYKKRFGQVSINELAQELELYVRANLKARKFSVIAFSQGGLVFRAFAMLYPALTQNVEKAFTVCTPHHGSLLAYCVLGKGAVDLRPGSKLLAALDAHDDGIQYYAVYNPMDSVVIPGTSAIFPKALKNEEVFALFHSFTFSHPKTLKFIESVLFDPPLSPS